MFIRHFLDALKMEKYYLLFACLLFLGSCLYGVLFFDQVQANLKEAGVFDQLEQVAKKIGKTPSFANTFSTIFFNNLLVSLLAIFSGIVFGMYPAILLVNNGLLVSVVIMGSAAQTNIHPFILFLSTILPHGIFELPAILIGAALGIHLGLAVIRALISLFMPNRQEQTIAEWKGIRSRFLVITSGVVICLFLAAIIEAGLIVMMSSFK